MQNYYSSVSANSVTTVSRKPPPPQPVRSVVVSARSELSRGVVWAALLTTASVVIAPYVLRGYTVGHDTAFHMSWWLEMAGLFRQGIIHARWAPLAYYGYGEAAFIFYPPLSLYAGGLLMLLLPLQLALGAYVWLVALASGFSFFYLCRHFFRPRAALAGAVAYVLNPYFLLEVHARCSLAELLVSALLPLFLLAVYRLDQAGARGIALAASLFAAIALSNAPLTVISAYAAVAFLLGLILGRRAAIWSFAKLGGAIALGAGLAAFFLLPARTEKAWVVASVHPIVPPAVQLVPLAIPRGHFAWALASVEFGQILFCLVMILLCRRLLPRDIYWALLAMFAVATLMVLPFSAAIWRTAPALVYVQFPWRWLGPMGLALSFFIAAGVQQTKLGWWWAAAAWAAGLVTLAAFTIMIDLPAKDLLAALENSITQGRGYLAWPFVLPREVKIDRFGVPYDLTPGEPAVVQVGADEAAGSVAGQAISPGEAASARITMGGWSAEHREFSVDAVQSAWIRVRLFWFPGWSAFVNGTKIDAVTTNSRGALLLHVPAGHNDVKLVYRGTRDQTAGLAISAFCFALLFWMLRKGSSGTTRGVARQPALSTC